MLQDWLGPSSAGNGTTAVCTVVNFSLLDRVQIDYMVTIKFTR